MIKKIPHNGPVRRIIGTSRSDFFTLSSSGCRLLYLFAISHSTVHLLQQCVRCTVDDTIIIGASVTNGTARSQAMTAITFRFTICCILLTVTMAFSPSHSSRFPPLFLQSTTKDDIPGLEYLDEIREHVSEHIVQWESCVKLVAGATGMDKEEAELRLAEATRWKAYAIVKSDLARKHIKTIVPTVEDVTESIAWLQGEPLQLNREQLQAAVRNHAETYLRAPAANFKNAKNTAPRKWRQNPDEFCQLVREEPRVLGLTYNCADDGCASECGSCWVTFGNSYK